MGLEGAVAKKHSSSYGSGDRVGWIKVKKPSHWRRDSEREAMSRKRSRADAQPVVGG